MPNINIHKFLNKSKSCMPSKNPNSSLKHHTRISNYNLFSSAITNYNSVDYQSHFFSTLSSPNPTLPTFGSTVQYEESVVFKELREQILESATIKLNLIKNLKSHYANATVSNVSVSSILEGMRGVYALITETSQIDPDKGILIHGLSIKELLNNLPRPSNSQYPFTESVFWFLLTGKIPTLDQANRLSKELNKLGSLPKHVFSVLDSLPTNAHPMMQYVIAVAALQTESIFKYRYSRGEFSKNTCWELFLQDSLLLMAKNLPIVAYIYNRTFLNNNIKSGEGIVLDPDLDYSSNLSRLLGLNHTGSEDMLRLYLAIHSDHEGGNVSAHSAHTIASALADPFLSIAGMLSGLSGPFHGLANQECILWLQNLRNKLAGTEPTAEIITKIAKDTLASGQVIPGYGHAVLRISDPRHDVMFDFAGKYLQNDNLYKLLDICLKCIPQVLKNTNRIKCPYPNVDCSTGVVLNYFGLKHPEFYTVLFGISRSMGALAQIVWSRALRMPIYRPKSCTLEHLSAFLK